ncbi:hypothetical protein Cgig2_001442 [Carnegiea gigantea]|uniref:Kinesin motor domain-containing protein n=1 Tax=Carnegiea gigantea TaxID=171969 RepID=A0A9Q1KRZ4_9CARY|nr:hypothetical protein Cgig2_001442 [Carnegiea gigantea]
MERIYVTVRARPLSPEDAKCSPWKFSGNSISFTNSSVKFDFDRIFGEDCKTKEVYEARTKEIVSAAVRGFNGTVFAYGQTNSGKTHTMRGSASEPGVIPLAVRDLFNTIQEVPDREFLLRMSYMEIYNEEINDLLAPEHRRLQIHESLEIIESRDKVGDEELGDSCDAVRVSVLNLVDLAGSERAAKTGAEGVRLKEGSHINKSLMTLGTVIKKLSEGAESQGGHVPYRDSKLTRILQPALGGNANTAIICNITLAQIHADETKSSLQFASRALRVTNCAHVNEILTDAALLKRQKKEIEELRAKLQGSRSEHLEEEILNLRNTLLQTELERERIALELEEEKRAQVEREKRLEEQAKKIKNLSSMVLYSNRDEIVDHPKKDKRRDTWCPGKVTWEISKEMGNDTAHKLDSRLSGRKIRQKREPGPLVPFEELVTESKASGDIACEQKEEHNNSISDDCVLPDPCNLLKVTNRRKAPPKKKSLPVVRNEFPDLQAAYEDLFLKFETQRIMYDVQTDCLKRMLTDNSAKDFDYSTDHVNSTGVCEGKIMHSEDTIEAILLISQLKDRIKELQIEKSSSDQSLEIVIDSAKEQNAHAMEKYEELYEELQKAKEEARVACEQSEKYRESVESFKSCLHENSTVIRSICTDYGALINFLKNRVIELENEKLILQSKSAELEEKIQNAQNSEKDFAVLSEQYDLERSELLSHIEILEREVSSLSSSSLFREKESLRKDLEKNKMKLKETESKLKNIMQEKTRLEGEKANAEREIKKLRGQKALLERDICKRDSTAGRRRDSIIDHSRAFDSKRARGQENNMQLTLQEDYKKLEVLAFEMETTIASLEEELGAANQEKEKIYARNESLSSELEMLSDKLDISNTELNALQEEISDLRLKLERSEASHQKLESQISLLIEEKEELATQLTNALLDLEEERAVWFAKEKASVEAIKEKANAYNDEVGLLSSELSKVRNEVLLIRKEYEALEERMKCAEEHAEIEKRCSLEKSAEIDKLKHSVEVAHSEKRASEELLKSKLDALSCEHNQACQEVKRFQLKLATVSKEREDLLIKIKEQETGLNLSNDLQMAKEQLQFVTEERDKLMAQIQGLQVNAVEVKLIGKNYDEKILSIQNEARQLASRLAELEYKMHDDEVKNSKERAKLRMRLRSTQAKLDAYRERYKEAIDEQEFMNKKFEEASNKLKDRLAAYGIEVLNLKKQLAAATIQ